VQLKEWQDLKTEQYLQKEWHKGTMKFMKKLVYFCLLVTIQPCYASEAGAPSLNVTKVEAVHPAVAACEASKRSLRLPGCTCWHRNRYPLLHDFDEEVATGVAIEGSEERFTAELEEWTATAISNIKRYDEELDEEPRAALGGAGVKRKVGRISGGAGSSDHASSSDDKKFKASSSEGKGIRLDPKKLSPLIIKKSNLSDPRNAFEIHGFELSRDDRALITGGFSKRMLENINGLNKLYKTRASQTLFGYDCALLRYERKLVEAMSFLLNQKNQALYLLHHGNAQQYHSDRRLCVAFWQGYEHCTGKKIPAPEYKYIERPYERSAWVWDPYFYSDGQIFDVYMDKGPVLTTFRASLPWVTSERPEKFLQDGEAQLACGPLREIYKENLGKVCRILRYDTCKMIHLSHFGSTEKWKLRMERIKNLMVASGQEEGFFASYGDRGFRLPDRDSHILVQPFLAIEDALLARPVAAPAAAMAGACATASDILSRPVAVSATSVALRAAQVAAGLGRGSEPEKLQ